MDGVKALGKLCPCLGFGVNTPEKEWVRCEQIMKFVLGLFTSHSGLGLGFGLRRRCWS